MRGQFNHLTLIAMGAALIAPSVAGCKQSMQFTAPAPVGLASIAPAKREPTTIGLDIPLPLRSALRAATDGVPVALAQIVEFVDEAACGRRNRDIDCNTARVEIDLKRQGDIGVDGAANVLKLTVPLAYDVFTRGIGWANQITERHSGSIAVTAQFATEVTAEMKVVVRLEAVEVSERDLPVFKRRLSLQKVLEPRFRKMLAPAADAIQADLEAVNTHDIIEGAWKSLATTISLSPANNLWLKIEPEGIAGGNLVVTDQGLAVRIGLLSDIQLVNGQRPKAGLRRPLPTVIRPAAEEIKSRLQLPVTIPSQPMLDAMAVAFPPNETLTAGLNDEPSALKVKYKQATLYPSRGQLGVEMALEVVGPSQWAGLIGTAHFVGRPVVRSDGVLEVVQFNLPDQSGGKPGKARPKSTIKALEEGPKIFRIGLEPFAGRLSRALRLDLNPALRDAMPHANSLLPQVLDGGFMLSGKFHEVRITGATPVYGGFEVNFEISGIMMLEPTTSSTVVTGGVRPASLQ